MEEKIKEQQAIADVRRYLFIMTDEISYHLMDVQHAEACSDWDTLVDALLENVKELAFEKRKGLCVGYFLTLQVFIDSVLVSLNASITLDGEMNMIICQLTPFNQKTFQLCRKLVARN